MNWVRIRELVRKEFIQLFRDRRVRPLLVISPLVQLIVFGYVVSTDVRDVTVALMDQSKTTESRQFIDAIDGNRTFRVVQYRENPAEMEDLLLRRKIDLVIKIPPDFSRILRSGRTASVQVLVDGSMSNMASVRIS